MQTIRKKFSLIYLPILFATLSFIILYTFLNWFVLINTKTFSIPDIFTNFWLPIVLPWIIISIFLKKRIKLLKNTRLLFLFQFISALAMTIPTIFAQFYIEKAYGRLTKLDSINQVEQLEQTKYYTLENFYMDKSNIGVYPNVYTRRGGKGGASFHMELYIVVPILQNKADTTDSSGLAWLGIKYSKQRSNEILETAKREIVQTFIEDSKKDFEGKDLSQFVYFDRIGNTPSQKGFQEAIKRSLKSGSKGKVVLLGINEPFENRMGSTFVWMLGSFGIGASILMFMLLLVKIDEDKVADL